MKLVQRLFMGLGGLAAVAALLTIVSPKAHALVATLVEVVNTRSTPVPNQDVDHPGRHPYQYTCQLNGSFPTCQSPIIPPNTEVVIQTVSVFVVGGSATYAQLATTGGGQTASTFIPLAAVGEGNSSASQSITQYIDPGTNAACSTLTNSSFFYCTITGYTVSLP